MTDSINTDSIDSLLDATLDDLDDMPSFEVFPPGAYQVSANMSLKDVGSNVAVSLELTIVEVVELADPKDKEPVVGDKSSVIFMLNNEFGAGNLKRLGRPFAEALGTSSIREMIDNVTDISCMVVTSVRVDKKDKNDIKTYLNIKELEVV